MNRFDMWTGIGSEALETAEAILKQRFPDGGFTPSDLITLAASLINATGTTMTIPTATTPASGTNAAAFGPAPDQKLRSGST